MLYRVIILLTCSWVYVSAVYARDWFPYVSPGIKIGFDVNMNVIISPRLSVGINQGYVHYVNITVGRSFCKTPKETNLRNHTYISCEFGRILMEISPLIHLGGGIGMAIIEKGQIHKLSPKLSFFGGSLLCVRSDHVIIEKNFMSDFGVMAFVPFFDTIIYYEYFRDRYKLGS